MARPVDIIEVFPRDGIQSLRQIDAPAPSTDEKVAIVELCREAGLREIEVTGFGHPSVTPDLSDAEHVMARLGPGDDGCRYRALVPNLRGAERAAQCGVRKIVLPLIASETYQRKNVNMTVAEHLRELDRIVRLVDGTDVAVAVGVGMCFACPYEGWMPRERVLAVVAAVVDAGIAEISLADTFGIARPDDVRSLVADVRERFPDVAFALHMHDAWYGALACCAAAYDAGIDTFEGALCGVGGGIAMPSAGKAGGNVATESLVYLFEGLGAPTGVDLGRLAAAADAAARAIGGRRRSRLFDGERRAELAIEAPGA